MILRKTIAYRQSYFLFGSLPPLVSGNDTSGVVFDGMHVHMCTSSHLFYRIPVVRRRGSGLGGAETGFRGQGMLVLEHGWGVEMWRWAGFRPPSSEWSPQT